MAKKAPKRKLNRKSRRLIRRSIAAVMMITAIGVAAIPVPDIQADTGSGAVTSDTKRNNVLKEAEDATADNIRSRVQYNVTESDYLNVDDGNSGSTEDSLYDLLDPTTADHKKEENTGEIYNVKQLSNGTWKYNLQFEYYVVQNETVVTELGETATVSGAIISKYNDAYEEQTVELQAINPVEYYEVKVDDYNDFYSSEPKGTSPSAGKGVLEFKLEYKDYEAFRTNASWGDKQADYDFLHHYFNAEYTKFESQCSTHYEKIKAAEANETTYDGAAPNPIAKIPNVDFTTSEEKYIYYCDYHYASDAPVATKGSLTLVYALDGSVSTTTTSSYVYLVRLVNGKTQSDLLGGAFADINGFVSRTQSKEIRGIANGAFKGVTIIDTLILPTEIKYIGDGAFESSFLQSISLTNVSDIGNKTFRNCSELQTVELGSSVNVIGAEAFSGCTSLKNITMPYSVKIIGAGAFSYCTTLENVDMSALKAGNNEQVSVGNYAFYDCYGLDNVIFGEMCGITSIGDGAFATKQTGTANTQGTWKNIVLPPQISSGKLGDWIFDGRTTLESVTFPSNYGYTDPAEVPVNMFRGCINLKEVIFPDTCGEVTFKPYLFLDVIEPNFYVSGPAENMTGQTAEPRKATWEAISTASDYIPYRYVDIRTGIEYYEVSDGNYLLTASREGVLTSCKLVDKLAIPSDGIDLVIPDYVGNYKIVSVASDCFTEPELRNNIRSIVIEDGSISEIADGTFMELPKLEEVVVGDSVTKIGNQAFAGSDKLVDVTFNSPASGNYTGFTIGTDAFNTGSSELTFHGDIVEGYAPFDWAMQADNYVNKDLGIRVCYKSLSPTNLTVMYDNSTGHRTLVDYPKYSRLDVDNQEFCEKMENTYYDKYADSSYDARRNNLLTEWNDLIVAGADPSELYSSETYGPWINQTWIDGQSWNNGQKPEAYFELKGNEYSIIKNYETPGDNEWQSLTPLAETWVNSALKIVVPAGIDSINVKEFLDSSSNRYNVITYLKSGEGLRTEDYDMYSAEQVDSKDNVKSVPGLFSGLFQDYTGDTSEEKKYRGNDRVEEIVLESVKTLPDYAFDSCENLKKVTIGPGCEDIGTAPFRGCDSLAEVVFQNNDKYTSNKAIIYSVNDDGSYTIEECLPYRGLDSTIAPPVVSLINDPDLANVTAIREGAFEDCNYVSSVDLRDSTSLKEIPEKAFKNCKILSQVYLPGSVDSIKSEAFAYDADVFGEDNPSRVTATIPGKEVHIATDAFEHQSTVTIRSYEDSAAHEYADYHKTGWENLALSYQVTFLDHDGSLIGEVQYVEEGKNATPPEDPVREGYTFIGWSEDYNGIIKDTILIAQYQQDGAGDGTGGNGGNGGTGGNGPGTDTDGDGIVDSDGKLYTVMVINGDGAGSYLSGSTVKVIADSPSTGQKFSHWSSSDGVAFANNNSATTTFVMPMKNITVTANYTAKSGSASGTVSGNNINDKDETKVTINKPGFSNTDISSAIVNGSPDNFIVKISETAAATQAVEAALTAEFGSLENIQYFPMDITLWDSTGTTKITDTTGLSVDITIPIPDALVKYSGNNKAAGVVNNRLDKLSVKFTTIDGVPCVTFRATHFSPYVIYVDTTNLTADTVLDNTPQTGDGIHPKWFLAIGLACISMVLFLKKDKVQPAKKTRLA